MNVSKLSNMVSFFPLNGQYTDLSKKNDTSTHHFCVKFLNVYVFFGIQDKIGDPGLSFSHMVSLSSSLISLDVFPKCIHCSDTSAFVVMFKDFLSFKPHTCGKVR